ncbi:uncharacterized protein BO66DRAFT_394821 [Aspergillus aculeatinus CBS 121060]|uniref:Uncharacterized protein n=1 Tax=Aspergillus aculeatinus CBS 121060 TaxID=1448322 RepID=A0ACD1GXQ0_9EURO|nr:hypothetical protein BO66DRAFT_394821 [Aspergillus aculeatinus CBS 121060]RAH66114.1 hypothetical protein BO66DRAFT_394821 [Aspergillus aculeatinus CBS 121060]
MAPRPRVQATALYPKPHHHHARIAPNHIPHKDTISTNTQIDNDKRGSRKALPNPLIPSLLITNLLYSKHDQLL